MRPDASPDPAVETLEELSVNRRQAPIGRPATAYQTREWNFTGAPLELLRNLITIQHFNAGNRLSMLTWLTVKPKIAPVSTHDWRNHLALPHHRETRRRRHGRRL